MDKQNEKSLRDQLGDHACSVLIAEYEKMNKYWKSRPECDITMKDVLTQFGKYVLDNIYTPPEPRKPFPPEFVSKETNYRIALVIIIVFMLLVAFKILCDVGWIKGYLGG